MYTKYYGLTRKPFENTPDPLFLFLSKKHREVLASLMYGINSAKGFVLIVGDIGTGKTTLIHALLKEINPTYLVVNIINPRSTFDDMMDFLAKKLGIQSEEKSKLEMIEAIQNGLEVLDNEGRRTVFIIDEAHLLSETSLEDIRLFSNIENESRKLIQIVLAGQNELYGKLQKDSARPLKQRLVISRTLDPLDKKETQDYINHRLRIAGRKSQLFDKKALSLIWRKSRGIPRLINQICDNALLIGFALEARSIGSKIIQEVIHDMEAGYRYKSSGSNLLFHRLKWLGAATMAALLIGYLAMNFRSDTQFNLRSWWTEQDFVSNQTDASTPEQKALTYSIKGSSTRPLEPYEKEQERSNIRKKSPSLESREMENDQIQANGEEEFSKTDENSGLRRQGIAAKGNITSQGPDVGAGENSIIKISEKRVTLVRQPLSKPKSEIESNKKNDRSKQKTVNPREYLFRIAGNEYGVANDTIIDLIQMANPNIKNVDRIFAGQMIVLPHIEKKDLIVKDEKGSYQIHWASFYDFENAQRSVQDLIRGNEEAFVIPALQGETLVYRIYLGIFKSRDEAQKTLNTLKLDHLPFLDKK